MFTLTQKCLPLLREAALEGGRDGETWKDPARIINVRIPHPHTLILYLYLRFDASVLTLGIPKSSDFSFVFCFVDWEYRSD